jgi:hypothetical protein
MEDKLDGIDIHKKVEIQGFDVVDPDIDICSGVTSCLNPLIVQAVFACCCALFLFVVPVDSLKNDMLGFE